METKKKKIDTLTMVELALLLAITIIMGTTPLGTIRTPFLSISLVTIPVAIGAIIIGPIGGIVCGLGFGFTSLYNALIGASGMMSTLMAVNPFLAVVTILVPRFLEGLCTAYLFKFFQNKVKAGKASYFLGAICCPLLNTILFMGCIVIFFYNSDYIQGLVETFGVNNPISFIIALVGVQGLIEAVSCCVLAGAVSWALQKAIKR